MTRRRGSFRRFMRGLAAAHEAGLPMRINIVVSNRNANEIPAMKAIANRYDIESFEHEHQPHHPRRRRGTAQPVTEKRRKRKP